MRARRYAPVKGLASLIFLCAALAASLVPAAELQPPLIKAARSGNVGELERLFLQGQDLNQTMAGRRTALHAAAEAAQDQVVAWLISHEANVFAKDQNGKTPADITTELGHRTTSTLLKKFMLLQTIEQEAVKDQSWDDLVEILTRDARHYTLLHVLAIRGEVEESRKRIRAGAGVDARTVLGMTPLMKAAGMGHAEMVRLLLASGADVNARDLLDNTALLAAVVAGKDDVVRLLLDAKADVTSRSRNGGGTALELARRMGREKIAAMLAGHGTTK
ncbi:MAG TPA: ankyrin repeat domain-containing protein [Patescibacteria group bacterium]|nr:ankyrin repeat domain-containing protein [Patescibacteria group bacterium]